MPEAVLLTIRVVPRADRDEIAGREGDLLRVRLRAPPVEGEANDALRRLPARRLGVPARQVVIVAGETARTKRVRIDGLGAAAVAARLDT